LYRVAYYHGRFQPFHNGHLEVVQRALEECQVLAIGVSNPFRSPPNPDAYIGSPEERESLERARAKENNPWPYWARVLMIREGLREAGCDVSRIVFVPNLSNTGLPLSETRVPKEIAVVFIATKDHHNQAAFRLYQREGWEVVCVRPKADMISASEIRQRIRDDRDWDEFVPNGTARTIRSIRGAKAVEI
jgi:nicotinamide-nucleotide adenylyltransferase